MKELKGFLVSANSNPDWDSSSMRSSIRIPHRDGLPYTKRLPSLPPLPSFRPHWECWSSSTCRVVEPYQRRLRLHHHNWFCSKSDDIDYKLLCGYSYSLLPMEGIWSAVSDIPITLKWLGTIKVMLNRRKILYRCWSESGLRRAASSFLSVGRQWSAQIRPWLFWGTWWA